MTAEEQAFHLGQAWEALPEPKRQFNFYVVDPNGEAKVFYIGPHAPKLSPDDVQLVHRLWLNMRRDPSVQDLHHSDIITYALTRLAGQYAREKAGDPARPAQLSRRRSPGKTASWRPGYSVSRHPADRVRRGQRAISNNHQSDISPPPVRRLEDLVRRVTSACAFFICKRVYICVLCFTARLVALCEVCLT